MQDIKTVVNSLVPTKSYDYYSNYSRSTATSYDSWNTQTQFINNSAKTNSEKNFDNTTAALYKSVNQISALISGINRAGTPIYIIFAW